MLTIQSILSGISCLTCTIIDLQVILSHGQRPLTCPLPPGVKQAPPVTSVLDDGTLEFKNGERAKPEVFLFCTGYNFTFPFLDKKVGVKVQEHLVWPLYKFLIPPAYPSLFIMGICRAICPFPHFHIQVSCKAKDFCLREYVSLRYFLNFPYIFKLFPYVFPQSQFVLSVLDGSFPLPSHEEMEKDIELDIAARRARGITTRHILKLDSEQWAYNDELAHLGGFKPLPRYWSNLYESNKVFRARDMLNYKTYNYTVMDNMEWKVHDLHGQQLQKPLAVKK